jgi:hypothetical protein
MWKFVKTPLLNIIIIIIIIIKKKKKKKFLLSLWWAGGGDVMGKHFYFSLSLSSLSV